jgi:8-oxo-dGTP pyrophosphatase MutT (NUDIX family)
VRRSFGAAGWDGPVTDRRARTLELQQLLLVRADIPAPDDWLPVVLGVAEVGVTNPEIAGFLATHEPRCLLLDYRLVFPAEGLDVDARSRLLGDVATRLLDAGWVRGWRDEQLDVRPRAGGEPLATIERAACRALGIWTHAVHLNAFDAEGRLVVARRADDKPIDPGFWDNLVGGMVASGESELEALARETQEEAGLDLARLPLARGGLVREARPVPEGYMVETVQVYDTRLPPGCIPRNQDGEVAAIEARPVDDVLDAIERGDFTLEAALVTLDALLRQP